jgi:hypothetical protein
MEFKTQIFFIVPFIVIASILFIIGIIRFIIGFYFEDNCPRCETNSSLERMKSSLINSIIPFIVSKHYFCMKCKKGFYKRRLSNVIYRGKSTNKPKKEKILKIANI